MKKVISLLIAIVVLGQTALAQMVPQDDPVGTVYSTTIKLIEIKRP